jgi:hypothetical protein
LRASPYDVGCSLPKKKEKWDAAYTGAFFAVSQSSQSCGVFGLVPRSCFGEDAVSGELKKLKAPARLPAV